MSRGAAVVLYIFAVAVGTLAAAASFSAGGNVRLIAVAAFSALSVIAGTALALIALRRRLDRTQTVLFALLAAFAAVFAPWIAVLVAFAISGGGH